MSDVTSDVMSDAKAADAPPLLVVGNLSKRFGGFIALQIWMGAGSFHRGGGTPGTAYLVTIGGTLTGIFVAFLFATNARYVQARHAAAEGWSVFDDPE